MRYKNQIFNEKLTVYCTISIVENETKKSLAIVFFEKKTKQTYLSFIITLNEIKFKTTLHAN